MKTELCADGTIVITPESGIEAYALDKWCRDEFAAIPSSYRPKLVVDFSGYPSAIKIMASERS
jgi:hypothetical protein